MSDSNNSSIDILTNVGLFRRRNVQIQKSLYEDQQSGEQSTKKTANKPPREKINAPTQVPVVEIMLPGKAAKTSIPRKVENPSGSALNKLMTSLQMLKHSRFDRPKLNNFSTPKQPNKLCTFTCPVSPIKKNVKSSTTITQLSVENSPVKYINDNRKSEFCSVHNQTRMPPNQKANKSEYMSFGSLPRRSFTHVPHNNITNKKTVSMSISNQKRLSNSSISSDSSVEIQNTNNETTLQIKRSFGGVVHKSSSSNLSDASTGCTKLNLTISESEIDEIQLVENKENNTILSSVSKGNENIREVAKECRSNDIENEDVLIMNQTGSKLTREGNHVGHFSLANVKENYNLEIRDLRDIPVAPGAKIYCNSESNKPLNKSKSIQRKTTKKKKRTRLTIKKPSNRKLSIKTDKSNISASVADPTKNTSFTQQSSNENFKYNKFHEDRIETNIEFPQEEQVALSNTILDKNEVSELVRNLNESMQESSVKDSRDGGINSINPEPINANTILIKRRSSKKKRRRITMPIKKISKRNTSRNVKLTHLSSELGNEQESMLIQESRRISNRMELDVTEQIHKDNTDRGNKVYVDEIESHVENDNLLGSTTKEYISNAEIESRNDNLQQIGGFTSESLLNRKKKHSAGKLGAILPLQEGRLNSSNSELNESITNNKFNLDELDEKGVSEQVRNLNSIMREWSAKDLAKWDMNNSNAKPNTRESLLVRKNKQSTGELVAISRLQEGGLKSNSELNEPVINGKFNLDVPEEKGVSEQVRNLNLNMREWSEPNNANNKTNLIKRKSSKIKRSRLRMPIKKISKRNTSRNVKLTNLSSEIRNEPESKSTQESLRLSTLKELGEEQQTHKDNTDKEYEDQIKSNVEKFQNGNTGNDNLLASVTKENVPNVVLGNMHANPARELDAIPRLRISSRIKKISTPMKKFTTRNSSRNVQKRCM